MYHSVSETIEPRRNAYFHICTSPRMFRQQMEFLAQSGYKTIGLGEAVSRLQTGARTAEKVVVLTFDDGYEDFYTSAFPILGRLGFTATVFLATAYIGEDSRKFMNIRCLTWEQIRELGRAGNEFGSHTATHPQLTTLPAANIQRELQSSKDEIEQRLGGRVVSFSYPFAFPEPNRIFREKLRNLLLQTRYENGVSTILGMADSRSDPLFLERLPLNSSDDENFLAAKLEGGYDWLHAMQFVSKLRNLTSTVRQSHS